MELFGNKASKRLANGLKKMTWVPGKSGNPKGRPPGRIKKATREVLAKLHGRDLPPGEMAAALLRRLFDISCDPANPVPVQIQAIGTALPYLAPRMQVVAATVRHTGSFDDCKTKAEPFAAVERDLGAHWSAVLRKALQAGDPDAGVIEGEVIEAAAAEQQPAPASS
jgi:hypothetical protein